MHRGTRLRIQVFAGCFFLILGLEGRAASRRFDLAPFGRPCCSTDEYRLPTRFDYGHPVGISRTADGRWAYGLQWAEGRDISEVVVRFHNAYNAADAILQIGSISGPSLNLPCRSSATRLTIHG